MDVSEKQILIVENECEAVHSIADVLNQDGFRVHKVSTVDEAMLSLRETPFDLLAVDLDSPGTDSLELIRDAVSLYSSIIAIGITNGENPHRIVRAMRNGAVDCVVFPTDEAEAELCRVIRQALHRASLQPAKPAVTVNSRASFGNIVGGSSSMQDIFQLIESVSRSNSSVLIIGETGTGKEMIAQAIHANSNRRDQRIVSVNCGAIPDNLLESEFFGHTRGAFTGAHQTRVGRFEQAHKGTLFLDEIGNMTPSLQVKLLRVLQEREFERVGGSEKIKVDVRIIAATSSKLQELVERNEFRMDLYYRLNVIHIEMPALRERRQDIPHLAKHFVAKYCDLAGIEHKTITQEAMKMLMNCNWMGNVRQLENVMERAIALMGYRTAILPTDLPQEVQQSTNNLFLSEIYIPDEGLDFNTEVSAFEKQLILQSLKKTGGSRCEAAKLLQLKRTTLVEKLKRLNLPDQEALAQTV